MTTRPALGFWQIWNMCFGFMGLQFGFALQNSNVSRIFQTLGASVDAIPALWIAAPLSGLLVQPIIGSTRSEALDKQAAHNSLVPLEGGLAILSAHLDFDLSTLPLDTVMAHRTEPQLQRFQTRYRARDGRLLTLREVAQNHGQSVGLPQIVGTAAEVADQLEAYVDHVGGDGFMLSPISSPGAIEDFVDYVVPELQRRGRYRRDYAGTTQRDHLREP